jgi:hypothetical protein
MMEIDGVVDFDSEAERTGAPSLVGLPPPKKRRSKKGGWAAEEILFESVKGNLPMRVALTAIAFIAVMLLSACVQPYDPAAFAGWSRERAQAACNAGNIAACNAANNLWAEDYYLL